VADLVQRIKDHPFVAHLLRALDRFNGRLGSQFAAAITYFSVLAMVPVLMFGFSMLGMTVTVLRPDLFDLAVSAITDQLGSGDGAKKIVTVAENALDAWRTVGLMAILPAAYAGAGWIGNLRKAVDAMWRPSFDITPPGSGLVGMVLDLLKNLAILVGLLVLGGFTIVASSATSGLLGALLRLLGVSLDGTTGSVLLVVAGVALSLLTGWLLFAYLYMTLPTERRPFREVAQGAVFGGIGLAVLQFFAGRLTQVFSSNAAIQVFGPVIVTMLAFNIFASIVMLGAAWTATADDSVETRPAVVDAGEPDAVLIGPGEMAELVGPPMVPEKIAQRGVKVGMGLGWLSGAATGLGIGAVIGRLLAGWVHWRRRRRMR